MTINHATRGSLTGLPTRQQLVEDMEMMLQNGEMFQIIKVDAVHLKAVNSVHGFKTGDAVLKHFAELLCQWHESAFRVYHAGAVSFYMLAAAGTPSDPWELYEMLHQKITVNDTTLLPKARVIKTVAEPGDTVAGLFDLISYASGKRSILMIPALEIGEELRKELLQQNYVVSEVTQAIKNKSFEMYYQPVYDMSRKCFPTAEALIRLRASDGAYISPGLFIPLAEEKYLIDAISDIVLEKVMTFLGEHPDSPVDAISVNLTPDQITDEDLPGKLIEIARESHTELHRVRLEITERTIQRGTARMQEVMERLKKTGVDLYLDDFGTGYSNMQSVINLPFEAVKFDKSIIDTLGTERSDHMVNLLSRMVHIGDAKIIAEGIETEEQYRYAVENGFDKIQGYYFSKPLPEQEYLKFIENHNK